MPATRGHGRKGKRGLGGSVTTVVSLAASESGMSQATHPTKVETEREH